MAWNEPGNGKQRDPWGGGDQGPPDLDEAFRKFREKLGAAFGGRGGSSSGGGNEAAQAGAVLALILALVGAIWFYLGVHIIDEQERAVVLRFGRFSEILDPGLNWNPSLIDTVIPVSGRAVVVGTNKDGSLCDVAADIENLRSRIKYL